MRLVKSTKKNEFLDKYYYLGSLYLDYNHDLERAKKYLIYFRNVTKGRGNYENYRQIAQSNLRQIANAEKLKNDPKKFNPIDIAIKDNPNIEIVSLSLLADGNIKAFIFNKTEQDYSLSDMNVSGKISNVEKLPFELYTDEINGGQIVSPDGGRIYFTKSEQGEKGLQSDIYYSEKTAEGWGNPIYLESINSKNAIDCKPFITADNSRMFFISEREGGIGLKDIWVSNIEGGEFSEPINLGKPVNTRNDENSPFVHIGGNVLYFSSKGHVGLGGYDVFFTKTDKNTGKYLSPQNIGFPINTKDDEINIKINIDATTTFLTTTSSYGGKGKSSLRMFDLYKEAKPARVTYARGKIFDGETREPLKARFEVIDPKSKSIVIYSISDPYTGVILLPIIPGNDYIINVSKEKYLFYSNSIKLKEFTIEDLTPPELEIPIYKIKKDGRFVLNNLVFDHKSSEILEESAVELDNLVAFLSKHTNIHIEVTGHTDNTGTKERNNELSLERATSVYNYLILHGFPKTKLSTRGAGSSSPIATNGTPEGRKKNRRTEVRVFRVEEITE